MIDYFFLSSNADNSSMTVTQLKAIENELSNAVGPWCDLDGVIKDTIGDVSKIKLFLKCRCENLLS